MSEPFPQPKARTVTQADLAAHLELDKSTVSLALRGSPKVGAATRARVAEAARFLGYRLNLAARQLATEEPRAVALALSPTFASLEFGATAVTIARLARQAAAAGVVFSVLSIEDLVKAIQGTPPVALQPDGVLVWGDVPAHVSGAIATRIPTVVLDPNALSYEAYPGNSIRLDNAGGSRQLAEHLTAQGAEHLLFVMANQEHLGHRERWASTRQTWLQQHALDSLIFCQKEELTDAFLQSFVARPRAAIACSNDFCALEVWHRLQRLGVGVPEQVLLTGFDAEAAGRLIGLTSVVFDGEALGNRAFEVLMQVMHGEGVAQEETVIPVRLALGRTTRGE